MLIHRNKRPNQMKPFFTLFFISLIFSHTSFAQNCLPEGIIFKRQSQIDSFPILHPSCDVIEGNVEINGKDYPIFNLNGLSGIRGIQRSLKIINCDSLQNLHGLEQLEYIYLYMRIQNNYNLKSIAHLISLDSIGGYIEIISNRNLENLVGLDKLKTLRTPNKITSNHSLTNLFGLIKLEEIYGELEVSGNASLLDLSGLDSLRKIGDDLKILNNSQLKSLDGISNLKIIGKSLWIQNNSKLSTCAVEAVCDHLLNGGNSSIVNNLPGCNSNSEVEAQCVTATNTPENDLEISIYPNPTHDFIEVRSSIDPQFYTLYDISGKLQKNWTNKSPALDISEFSPGIYILNIQWKDLVMNKKVIKE